MTFLLHFLTLFPALFPRMKSSTQCNGFQYKIWCLFLGKLVEKVQASWFKTYYFGWPYMDINHSRVNYYELTNQHSRKKVMRWIYIFATPIMRCYLISERCRQFWMALICCLIYVYPPSSVEKFSAARSYLFWRTVTFLSALSAFIFYFNEFWARKP